MPTIKLEQIDALLPQTQCGQCGYGGCLPYAKAITQGEALNRCPPGGINTLTALAKLLERELSIAEVELMRQQEQSPARAKIRVNECIGCTKCIQACPVDAIIGAAKQLHTVLENECTGCGLCIEPCPVDCIDTIPLQEKSYLPDKARQRYQARQLRLQEVAKTAFAGTIAPTVNIDKKKAYIQAAVERAKNKKLPVKTGSSVEKD